MERAGGASTSLRVHGGDVDIRKQLADLYEQWGKPKQAAEWHATLNESVAAGS